MNRKDFLWRIWKRSLQPLCVFALLCIALKYLIRLFDIIQIASVIKIIIVLVLSFIVIYTVSYLLLKITIPVKEYIVSRLSEQHRLYGRIIAKFISYLALLALGVVYYVYWQKNWWMASILIAMHLVSKVRELYQQEQAKMNPVTSVTL